MHGALAAVAVLLAAAGYTTWTGEQSRSADAELINLAGRHRMLSQRVALLGATPPGVEDDELLRRQHAPLRAQADQLTRLALVAERTHNAVVITDVDGTRGQAALPGHEVCSILRDIRRGAARRGALPQPTR